jgi:hypothetical protein
MTNMENFHTFPIGGVHLVTSSILVTDSKVVKLASDVMRGTDVRILVGIDTIGSNVHLPVLI